MAKDENGKATQQLKEAKEAAASGDVGGVLSAAKNKELLTSAALSAAGALAAAKAPSLMRKLAGATEQKGEEEAQSLGQKAVEGAKESIGGGGGIAGKAVSKALGGGSSGSGGKKTRRLPIQRWTDVALPVDQVYEEWTKFDQFPQFMHRVLNVEQKDTDKISWQEKIWFSTRAWEGRVTERRENDRIVWTTKSGMSHKGIVSFHELSDNLTRVMVDMEFEPNGVMEKMASGLRFVKRAVQADLARFKSFVEMQDAEGIEYRPNQQDENEDDEQNGEEDEQAQGKGEEQDVGEDEDSADGDDEDADADEPVSREDKSEEEREQEREERRQRRRERQKASR
jgi:uncharacterized membrane protein